jgi:ribosomal protein S1
METNVVPTESAQPEALADLKRKTQFTGKVIKTTLAGAVVDIGLEVPGVIHISQLQEQHTNRVDDVVQVGQTVEVWVKRVDPKKDRIDLTMIRPLELEWREIAKGMTLKGKVTRLEKFGAFVDIGAERPGLVHISEMTHDYIKSPGDVVKEGDEINVQVLEVNRRKKQIKLSMKALEEKPDAILKATQQIKEKEKDRKEAKAEEAEKDEPVPTAMEMALREAMERTRSKESVQKEKGRRKPAKQDEIENILERTLQHKVRTGR